MVTGLIVEAMSLMFVGPEESFGLKKNLATLGIGLAMLGFSSNFFFLPALPEMVEAGNDLFNIEQENLINDMVSGFFTAANLSAEVIGPLFAFLAEYVGVRIGCLIFACYLIFVLILFLTLGKAYYVFKKHSPSHKGLIAKKQQVEINKKEIEMIC